MKVSKIPGLGRFGVFVDDLDFNNLSDDDWLEIGKLHLKNLVTIIRNVNITPRQYELLVYKWGVARELQTLRLMKKYQGANWFDIGSQEVVNGIAVPEEDKKWVYNISHIMATDIHKDTRLVKVSGKKSQDGAPEGLFAEGELLWHSNESGQLCFTPGVGLLGVSGVVGSATGFATTTDWYESQSESFRSELDEMIICHEFTPGRINPGLRIEQDQILYKNMCPTPQEIPLVIQSPGGITGLHYSVNTINTIKGMTITESQKIFDIINGGIFSNNNIYDHWYQQDNDLLFFDNSITLHRRLGGITNRLCYRLQHDYSKIAPIISPYFQEPYKSQHDSILSEFLDIARKYNY